MSPPSTTSWGRAVRDWKAFVAERLRLPGLAPGREVHIVRDVAAQLEDFYREALAAGASEADADAHACRQIRDWEQLARDVLLAERSHRLPPVERLANRVEAVNPSRGGVLQMLADVLRDARYGVRQLGKSPGFAVVAILTLALGIGATSAMFSVINGVLLRPLPFPDPDALVRVHEIVPQYGRFSVAPATFLDWRAQSTSFDRIIALQNGSASFTAPSGAERITNAQVSWDFFEMARVHPMLGRTFREDEDVPGKNDVVILSHAMWQQRFGADRNIVGQAIPLNGTPATIVGVMPPDFRFPRDAEYWTPLALDRAKPSRGGHFLAVIARLKTGVAVSQASTEMKTISERLAQQYPANSADESAEVVPLLEQIVGGARQSLLALLAAVGVVVLIACANVANLLLVRASVREKEIAIRTALGAGKARLIRQMLAESLVLAVAGGGLGILLAYLVLRPIQTLSAGSIPRVQDISIDGRVLLFACVVSLATGILFGLAPAWQASRWGIAAIMKEGGRSSSSGGGRWLRNALLVAEVALSLVLLVGAVLLLRSFDRVTRVDPGFRADNVLAFRVSLPNASYREDHHRIDFFDRLTTRLEQLPDVRAAGMIQTLPMRGGYFLSFSVQGRPEAKPGEEPSANHRVVSAHYFAALGIPIKRGRLFTAQDTETTPMVAVVDEAFAARHFPNEDPIGRGIDIGNGSDGFYRIVGIAGNVHHGGLEENASPTMYVPFRQDVFSSMWLVVRTDRDPAQLIADARRTVGEIDPALPAYSMTPLRDVVAESLGQRRFSMLLLSAFALTALFLAGVGIYGVVGYSVSQRTQEIGVRLAIGAERRDVLTLVVGGGMKLAVVGVALGLAGALALAQLITSMLFNVTPFDPASYALTAGVLLAIAALACYVPARRAMNVDPLIAIRQE
jgi:putative ABC transport system permease protein